MALERPTIVKLGPRAARSAPPSCEIHELRDPSSCEILAVQRRLSPWPKHRRRRDRRRRLRRSPRSSTRRAWPRWSRLSRRWVRQLHRRNWKRRRRSPCRSITGVRESFYRVYEIALKKLFRASLVKVASCSANVYVFSMSLVEYMDLVEHPAAWAKGIKDAADKSEDQSEEMKQWLKKL